MQSTPSVLFAAALIFGMVRTPGMALPSAGDNSPAVRPVPDTASARPAGQAPGPNAGHAQPDTLTALRKKAAFDSLEQIRSEELQRYMKYPASLDSVFDPDVIGPYRSMNSSAVGLSEVLRASPLSVAVPFALSSGLSRFMLFGFPLLTNAIYSDGNPFGECPDAVHGTDDFFSTRLFDAAIVPPLGVRCSGPPQGIIAPQTDVLWENGVFQENLLGVRFTRPLTKATDIGIFSDFRDISPFNYSTANDIKSFYGYFFKDTTMLANGGRNPLSDENRMTLSLASHKSNETNSSVSYSYIDSKSDQAVQLYDSSVKKETLNWRTLSRYASIVNADSRGLALTPLGSSWPEMSVNFDGRAVLEGHRLYTPIVNSPLVHENMGRNTELMLGIEPYAVFGAETLSVAGRAGRKDQTLYNGAEPVATVGDLRLGFRHGRSWGPLYASLALSAGDGAVKPAGGPVRNDFVYSVDAAAAAGIQRLHVFALRDHLPFVLPYDSLGVALESYNDVYESYGADLFLGVGKIGLAAGVCAVSGADTSLAARFWSDAMMPYRQPAYSLMATPMLGRIAGFSLSSRMLFSDRRPYVKSQTALSYQADPIPGREHITADLLLDYWSGRDSLSYAGTNTWNREIFNLSLVTGVHIRGFCLFYKIDNILNRKYAYVPGYFMPGITFRWGFQWLIPG